MTSIPCLRSLTFMIMALVVLSCFVLNQHDSMFSRRPSGSTNSSQRTDALPLDTCPITGVLHDNLDVLNNPRPLITLDRQRYLLPYLRNGPNNQLIGLRDSIYLAIRLNRTLVLPLFIKHRSDDQSQFAKTISSEHRINIRKLAQLVPFVTLDQFRKECDGRVDVIFRTRVFRPRLYLKFSDILNVEISPHDPTVGRTIVEFPLDRGTENDFYSIPSDPEEIRKLFGTEEKCAFHPYPFKNLRIKPVIPTGFEPLSINLSSMSDSELYSEIIRFTQLPSHVKRMSREFISARMGNKPYLSLHWRFDREDWQKRCSLSSIPERRRGRCNIVKDILPEHVAQAVISKLRELDDVIRFVYIASPPSENASMQTVRKMVEKTMKVKVITGSDVMVQWRLKYESCDWLWRDVNDLLSSTEMEICSKGHVFLWSVASSWSGNVAQMRTNDVIPAEYLRHDVDVLSLIQNILKTNQTLTTIAE